MSTWTPERWDVGQWDQAHWDGQLGLNVTPAAVSITGRNVALRVHVTLTVTGAAVTVTGQDIMLRAAARLTIAPPAAVAVTGQDVGLLTASAPAGLTPAVTPLGVVLTPGEIGLFVSHPVPPFVPPPGVLTFGQRVFLRRW
jgi:hypothetical protein